MESSASRNAMLGLKIAGVVIVAYFAWKVLAFLTGIIWVIAKLALVVAIIGGAGLLIARAATGRSLPGGRRSLP